jgi:hypothetical protein
MIYDEANRILASYKSTYSSDLTAHPTLLINSSRYIRLPTQWGLAFGNSRYFFQTWWRTSLLQWFRMRGLLNWFHVKNCQQVDEPLDRKSPHFDYPLQKFNPAEKMPIYILGPSLSMFHYLELKLPFCHSKSQPLSSWAV